VTVEAPRPPKPDKELPSAREHHQPAESKAGKEARAPTTPAQEESSEVLSAVFKWIATEPSQAPTQRTDQPPPKAPPAVAPETEQQRSHAEPVPPPHDSPSVPDRQIEIVEELVEEARTEVGVGHIPRPENRPPVYVSTPEDSMRISIGSFEVHVEAPPAALPPTARARRPAETPASAPPANTLSRLRRYYVIPH